MLDLLNICNIVLYLLRMLYFLRKGINKINEYWVIINLNDYNI